MKIFIGSSSEQLDNAENVARWLENLGQEPILWTSIFPLGTYTLEALINVSNIVDAAVFVFGEDDKSWYRDNTIMSVRDNVLFEYGLFSGKLSRNKVIFLCKGNPKIASDLVGITYGNLDRPLNAKHHIMTWINNIESENTNPNKNMYMGNFMITDLYSAFQIALKENVHINTFRVFAISTFKSVQMLRLMSDLNIENARVLLRKYIENDFFYEESMEQIINIATKNWETMFYQKNISSLNLSFFNYHPDEGFYIIDDRYLILGYLNFDNINKKSTFANNVMLIDALTEAGKKCINNYIERFEKIYQIYEENELFIS